MKGGQNTMENPEYEAMLRASEHNSKENSSRMKRDLIDRLRIFDSYMTTEINRLHRISAGISGARQNDWAHEHARAYESAQCKLYEVFSEIDPNKS